MKKIIFFAAVIACILSCKKSAQHPAETDAELLSQKTISVMNTPYSPDNPILKNANTDFEIGAAVNEVKFGNSLYTGLASTQYNSITAENEMKFANIQATQHVFTFGTDITGFAQRHGINRVHGHAIMWYRGVPEWVVNAGGSTTGETRKQIYRSILWNHINSVFTFYYTQKDANGQPLVKSWDVVNEAFNDDGTYRSAAFNVWAKELGEYDAVRLSFLYAKQIAERLGDTDLKLFYNDYGHEYSNAKTDAIYNMVNSLKAISSNNKPIIDGVGLQMHTSARRTVSGNSISIYYAINKMSQTGLLVHISELDINLSNGTTGDQDYRWYNIPKIYRQLVPSARRWGITLWNIGDSDNWQGTAAAATSYAPTTYAKKSAYVSFYRGLNE
jgi:endo-1,4-beta-xylanase